MKHLFILNRFAGTHDATGELLAQIKELKADGEIITEFTSCKGDATAIARRYAESGDELRVYACGGDGTANEALCGILGHDNCALGVIPVGTGNDYVRSLAEDTGCFLDLQRMVNAGTRRVDIMMCEGIPALNVISAGYDCEVADRAQKFKRLPLMNGSLAYKLAIVYCLFTKRRHTFVPVADKKRVPLPKGYKSQMLAVAAKGKFYGGGIKSTPCAELSDGMIDFVSIPTIAVPKFIGLLSTFIKGEHIDNPKLPFITHYKCRELTFDNGGLLKIGIDGEMYELENPTMKVIPAAFDVIVPT